MLNMYDQNEVTVFGFENTMLTSDYAHTKREKFVLN